MVEIFGCGSAALCLSVVNCFASIPKPWPDQARIAAGGRMWTVKSLRYTLWSDEPNFGRIVSALLAGIVWVDLVAVGNVPREFGVVFVGLFLAALLFQKFVPAT